jgi:hypothetical protein
LERQRILEHFNGSWLSFYKRYLPSLKQAGKQALASCPFHQDKHPSFNIDPKKGLYFCHGCGKKGDPFHFFAKLHGLDDRRDYPKILKQIADDFGISDNEVKSRIAKTYDYVNADGELLFQTCRKEPKAFTQRRSDGKGGWVYSLDGVPRVLYRLPEILKAEEVIMVEGEKDVDALCELGFTATTCPMGARKWRDEYNETLKAKNLVLIPDNDVEGREHMTQVAMSLNGTARSLKWIDLPDLPSKGDVSDWLAQIGDPQVAAERLAIMIEGTPPYEPPAKKSLDDLVMPVSEFLRLEIPERRALLHPWLKEESINLGVGWRGTGKTWFALGICNSVTKGQPFGPWKAKEPTACLFLDGEMPIFDLLERIRVLGCDSPQFHVYSDYLANQWGLPRAHLANESWRVKMTAVLKTRKIKVFALDNLASLAAGLDENSKRDWDPINQWLLQLRFNGISTIMLHHVGKEGTQRGTSAREDNIDASIILRQPADYMSEQGARFIVHFSKARIRTADLQLIGDTEFSLAEDENGSTVWTWGNVRGRTRVEVLRMLDEGIPQVDIAKLLGISKGYVSRIRAKALADNHLGKNGKLTQSGFALVYSMAGGEVENE